MSENQGLLDVQIFKESLKYLNEKAQELLQARLIFTGTTIALATFFAYANAKKSQTPTEFAVDAALGVIGGLFVNVLALAATKFTPSSMFPKLNEEALKHQQNVTAAVLSGDLQVATKTNKDGNNFVFYAREDKMLSNPIRVRKSRFLPKGRLQVYAEITKQRRGELGELRKSGVNTNIVNGFVG